jgi:CO/xanthine dehydrogenase Mo-binding subunit
MTHLVPPTLARRDLLKGAGALVVTIAIASDGRLAMAQAVAGAGAKPPLAAAQLDSWIAVHQDGSVTAFFGKMDMGQGVDVAIAQIVAEELDVAVERVKVVMGDTALTVNQGGASGSTGIERGGIALRNAAAEARRALLDMAAAQLGVPADRLVVTDGTIASADDASRHVSYSELVGDRYFNLALEWNGKLGNDLVATRR